MKARTLLLLASLAVAGCDAPPPGGERASAGNSPLAAFDKTRLWILVRASRVGDGKECADYYRMPDDVRYRGLANRCEAWTLNFADYLKLNGLPDVEAAHLRDLTYWEWFEQMRSQTLDCLRSVGKLPVTATGEEMHAHSVARYACDPYDEATYTNKQTPESLGIRYK